MRRSVALPLAVLLWGAERHFETPMVFVGKSLILLGGVPVIDSLTPYVFVGM